MNEIEYGYCHCGCGQKTKLAPRNRENRGWVKGEPQRFIPGHGNTGRASKAVGFFENVTPGAPDECWPWKGTIDRSGYGQLGWRHKLWKSHRVSYEIYKGDPGSLHVLHTCDNPACVNPNHLKLGTNTDNVIDMFSKGRGYVKGKMLTFDEVSEIRRLSEQGESRSALARKYGVHCTTITNIALYHTRKTE